MEQQIPTSTREQISTVNWQELNEFLTAFRVGDHQSNSSDTRYILKTCTYCGKPADEALITADRFDEDLCPSCRSELVCQRFYCQQLADETTHNVEQLFSISWKKHIKIEKLTEEIPTCVDHEDKSMTDKLLNKVVVALEKLWDKERKPGIFSNVALVKAKKNICKVRIRVDTPVGTVVAELVRLIISDYLETVSLSWQEKEGITAWCTVNYLAIMDYMRYAVFYDRALTNSAEELGDQGRQPRDKVITSFTLAGREKYAKFRKILNPCTAPITPLHRLIVQFTLETE